jgi:hypothetical protein
MRLIFCLLLCASCAYVSELRAQNPAEQTPEQVLEPVLKKIRVDDISKALSEISLLGKLFHTQEQVEEMLLKRKQITNGWGKSLGEVELIDITRVGIRVVHLTYMEHSEFYPIVWRFTMYRGSKQWRILGVGWKHEFDDLLEKSNLLSQKPENLKR